MATRTKKPQTSEKPEQGETFGILLHPQMSQRLLDRWDVREKARVAYEKADSEFFGDVELARSLTNAPEHFRLIQTPDGLKFVDPGQMNQAQ